MLPYCKDPRGCNCFGSTKAGLCIVLESVDGTCKFFRDCVEMKEERISIDGHQKYNDLVKKGVYIDVNTER